MATCQSYNCDTLGSYDQTLANCTLFRKAGISEIILLACGVELTDPEDEAEIAALLAAEEAWYMPNLKVGIDAPSQETADPVTACGTQVVVNNVYTGQIFDAKVSATNTAFVNKLIAGYSIGGMLLKICDTEGLTPMMIYVDAEVNFSGGLVVPNTNSEYIRYEVNFTFKSNALETLDANPYFN